MAAHASLGASGASRWMNCPGSVGLSAGRGDQTSSYAQYGTAAHALAEQCLSFGGSVPADALGTVIEGVEVDAEMVEIVEVYLAEIDRRMEGRSAAYVGTEVRVTLESLNPPAEMFGTADFVAVLRDTRKMLVIDLKAGAGVAVSAVGNKQLRYYALAAYLTIAPDLRSLVDTVEMVIVQPRAGGVTEDTMDTVELVVFGSELLEAANAAAAPGGKLVPGDHCRWCRAKGACPAQADMAIATAQGIFGDDPIPDPTARAVMPGLLTDEQLAVALERSPMLEQWLSSVWAEAMARLSSDPDAVPGWKLVAKRARRVWRDEDQAAEILSGKLPDDVLFSRSLLSPAQVEKCLPKGDRPMVGSLVVSASSGPTLARASDPRPALVGDPFASDPL